MKRISFNFHTPLVLLAASVFLIALQGCDSDDPEKEDAPELITKVTLTFTPAGGGSPVVVNATDPDGEGIQNIAPDGPITLAKAKTYVLTIQLINGLVTPGEEGYDLTEEVENEGDEHQFFFSWTNNVFADPAGNGNIDNRSDAVNYTGGANAVDANNRPLGLTTTWSTSGNDASGSFTILLKHQPGLKSDTSTSSTGETDLVLSFTVTVQ